MNNKKYLPVIVLILFALTVSVWAAVPNSTPADTIQTYNNGTSIGRFDYVVVDGDYFWEYNGTLYNLTSAIAGLAGVNATNEWGLVYGTTGDWFNYTVLTGAVPVYIGLQMHPLNVTIGGEYVIPNVYDKDATHWQLELFWLNGTQCNKDCLVMYYAHINWDNLDGLTYILPNGEQA